MKKVVFLILSTGWVFTLLIGLYLNVTFIENEVFPVIYETEVQLNSFPYIHTVKALLGITAIWFFFVLIGWSLYFIRQARF